MRRTEFMRRATYCGAVLFVVAVLVAVWALAAPALVWDIEVVDSLDSGHASLTVDTSGHPHICYHGALNQDLKYAYEDPSGWHMGIVDSVGSVGLHTSLAVDASGLAHISYYDDSNQDLKYAYGSASGWHVETVDSLGSVGEYTSVALDASGWPHISYYDGTSGELKYAYCEALSWHIQTVDAAESVGQYTSLALDASGFPHISYFDARNEDLKYAYEDASGWHVETVDAGSGRGFHTSLALDAAGFPHISYLQLGGIEELWLASRDGSDWHTQMVVGGHNPNELHHTSLALDAGNHPHLAWCENYCGHVATGLRYGRWDGSGWQTVVVDPIFSAASGGNRMLALDRMGFPHIAYSDDGVRGLKYASGFPASIALTGELIAGELVLTWTPLPVASAFWVYGASNQAYFVPGFSPGYEHRLAVLPAATTTWSSANGVGDPTANWTYLVLAVDATEQELCRSNSFGEFDLSTDIE